MKDTKNVKNYCKTEVEPNSISSRAYHFIDSLWFIASQNTLAFTIVCPQEQNDTMIVKPSLDIIKLNMSCTAASSYLTLLPYYHNESKLSIQVQFIDNLKFYDQHTLKIRFYYTFIMGLTSKFGNCSSQPCLISQKDIPIVLKDTKDIPMRHLILIA